MLKLAILVLLGAAGTSLAQSIGYRTSELRLESNRNYNFNWGELHGDNINHGGASQGAITCIDKSNILIENLVIRRAPRHAFWVQNCRNMTIRNIHIYDPAFGGIRFEPRSTNYVHTDITVEGIEVSRTGGHGVEFWDLDGFTIGRIKATNTSGCGVLFNRNRNGYMERVEGNRNDEGGDYATLRFANNAGPGITVDQVYSRNSGRGVASTSNAHDNTINWVDINQVDYGIRFVDSNNMKVWSGSSRGSIRNCHNVGSTNINWGDVDCGCGINCAGG